TSSGYLRYPEIGSPRRSRKRELHMNKIGYAIGLSALSWCLFSAGCAKKAVVPQQTPAATVATPAPAHVPAQPLRSTTPTPREPQAVAAVSRPTTPDAETRARIQDLLNRIEDAYFDYDAQNIRADAQIALKADSVTLSEILKD